MVGGHRSYLDVLPPIDDDHPAPHTDDDHCDQIGDHHSSEYLEPVQYLDPVRTIPSQYFNPSQAEPSDLPSDPPDLDQTFVKSIGGNSPARSGPYGDLDLLSSTDDDHYD